MTTVAGETAQFGHLIQGNIIENVQGHGISINNNASSASAPIQAQIMGNRIKGCQNFAINVVGLDCSVVGNRIENWDLANISGGAIGNQVQFNIPTNMTIRDNFYSHSTSATKPLCENTGATGGIYVIDGNISPTGNPIFGNGAFLENSGTGLIASGTTSVAITHNLIQLPTADQITITPTAATTNAPGLIYLSSITSTQFTVHCASNPGSGGLAFQWHARIPQPFVHL
jgi:hypothetical protein